MKRVHESESSDAPHSELLALLPAGSEAPGVSEALALADADLGVRSAAPLAPEQPDARWEVELELIVPGRAEPALARAWLEPAELERSIEHDARVH